MMDRNQALLLYKGYQHVLGVGAMDAFNSDSRGSETYPTCFVCELYRAGIFQRADCAPYSSKGEIPNNQFDVVAGITVEECISITSGQYTTGPECAAIVKDLIIKYGYGDLFEERNSAQEIYQIGKP